MSQADQLLAVMERGEEMTPAKAYAICGTLACHSRMSELRERGLVIECRIVTDGRRRWGSYRLVGPAHGELSLAVEVRV
jgi:hypothetical protein